MKAQIEKPAPCRVCIANSIMCGKPGSVAGWRTTEIRVGDCVELMRQMSEKSVQCVVTSPPYWGLRQYIDDDAPEKQHEIGLEPTPEAFVAKMVEVFREVRRVLRDDGTVWLNLGDSYAGGKMGRSDKQDGGGLYDGAQAGWAGQTVQQRAVPTGYKAKDLLGIPWRVALALQADGWWLRSDIIWAKPNPMPSSVTDRPTTAHEYVFLLSKRARYYYDADAVREKPKYDHKTSDDVPSTSWHNHKEDKVRGQRTQWQSGIDRGHVNHPNGRNLRSVWTIPTEGFSGAHFACFPRKLVKPCILAGTSEKGCCPECGAPWVRIVDKERVATRPAKNNVNDETGKANRDPGRHVTESRTVGWQHACNCHLARTRGPDGPCRPVPCAVLDPFCGTGRALRVAYELGRQAIGLELSPEYAEMASRWVQNPDPIPVEDVEDQKFFDWPGGQDG